MASALTALHGRIRWLPVLVLLGAAVAAVPSGWGQETGHWDYGTGVISAPPSDWVGIGTATPQANLEISSDTTWPNLLISGHNGRAPFLTFYQSAGPHDAPSNIGSYEGLGEILFRGFYGTTYQDAAAITAGTEWMVGNGSMPGHLVFWTVPNGGSTLIERMRIGASGNVGIGTDGPSEKLSVSGGSVGFDYGYGLKINTGAYRNILTTGWDSYGDYVGL